MFQMLNLFEMMAQARRSRGLSQDALAAISKTDRQAIARLEAGTASATLLLRVMADLDCRLVGIGKGSSLPVQLRSARQRVGLSLDQVAERASLTRKTVAGVEAGQGSAASLVAVLNAIAPKARKAEPIRTSFDYNHDDAQDRDKRFTPPWFLDHVASVFGPIDLDPCGHSRSAVVANRRICLPDDGLSADWGGGLVYVNPPFSGVVRWMDKAVDEWERGTVKTIVMLTPVRVDSPTFQKRVHRHADVVLMAGRMRFVDPEGRLSYPAPFGLMASLFGAADDQIERFIERVPGVRLRRDPGAPTL
jgi:transcriptional regulator with XRE-family HTH domain